MGVSKKGVAQISMIDLHRIDLHWTKEARRVPDIKVPPPSTFSLRPPFQICRRSGFNYAELAAGKKICQIWIFLLTKRKSSFSRRTLAAESIMIWEKGSERAHFWQRNNCAVAQLHLTGFVRTMYSSTAAERRGTLIDISLTQTWQLFFHHEIQWASSGSGEMLSTSQRQSLTSDLSVCSGFDTVLLKVSFTSSSFACSCLYDNQDMIHWNMWTGHPTSFVASSMLLLIHNKLFRIKPKCITKCSTLVYW